MRPAQICIGSAWWISGRNQCFFLTTPTHTLVVRAEFAAR